MIEFPRTREGKKGGDGGGGGGAGRAEMEKEGLKREQGVCRVTEVRMHRILEKMRQIKHTLAHAYGTMEIRTRPRTPTPPSCTSQISPTCVKVTNRFLAKLYSWTCKLHGLCTPGSEITPHCSLHPV